MYSVVMMMALAGSAEAPECGRLRCCGCSGYYACSGCYGCTGCTGCYGCSGCYGCHGWHHGCSGCYGYSGYGCAGCFGSYGAYAPIVVPAAPPAMAPATPPPGASQLPGLPPPNQVRAPATIQVNTPTEAVIYFDSYRTTASGNRRFTTPNLEPGKTYFYTVKIEVNHDGQTVATSERVIVRAGDTAQVSVNVSPTGSLVARQN